MMHERELKAELDLPAADAAERLSDIALGLANGEVDVAAAGGSHLLRPAPDVRMELDAIQGERDGKLNIALAWKSHLGYSLPEWLARSNHGLAAEVRTGPGEANGGGRKMPEGDRSFEFSTRSDPDQTAEYLERVARYVRAGLVRLSSGNDAINLAVEGDVKLEITAESKPEKGKGSLRVELSWKPSAVKEEPGIVIAGAIEDTAVSVIRTDGARATH